MENWPQPDLHFFASWLRLSFGKERDACLRKPLISPAQDTYGRTSITTRYSASAPFVLTCLAKFSEFDQGLLTGGLDVGQNALNGQQ